MENVLFEANLATIGLKQGHQRRYRSNCLAQRGPCVLVGSGVRLCYVSFILGVLRCLFPHMPLLQTLFKTR